MKKTKLVCNAKMKKKRVNRKNRNGVVAVVIASSIKYITAKIQCHFFATRAGLCFSLSFPGPATCPNMVANEQYKQS